jgi:hypothetical protein
MTETPTQTPSPTPTNQPFFAYAFMDQSANTPRLNLRDWMTAQGSTWKGFNTAPTQPSTVQATFDSQLNAYLSYSGWGVYNPAVLTSIVPQTSGGNDPYGQASVAYKFQTALIPIGTFSSTTWVTWFISTAATNGQIYSTINQGSTAAATTSATIPATYTGLTINYSGSANLPAGTYKMYQAGTFNLGTGNLPQYFRGGTLT